MKISLLITAIIIALAASFGLKRKEEFKVLQSEWEELKTTATEKNISTDPKATFSAQRSRNNSARLARENAVRNFSAELIALAQEMKNGSASPEMESEALAMMNKFTSLSSSELKSLIKILSNDNTLEEDTKRKTSMIAIMMIANENPEGALALITESSESLALGEYSHGALPMIISQYATQNPTAAAQWLSDNEKLLGDEASEMKRSLIINLAKNDFDSALALTKALEFKDNENIFEALAIGITEGSQDKFLKALQASQVSKDQRNASLRHLAYSPFMQNFEAASTWLESPQLSDTDRNTVLQNISYHNITNNPGEWLIWVDTQENLTNNERTSRQIFQAWIQDNFVAAGEWLQSKEDGPSKQNAVKTYAETIAPHEPAAAVDWALTLPEGSTRKKLLQKIHRSLKEKDPSAAATLAKEQQLKTD